MRLPFAARVAVVTVGVAAVIAPIWMLSGSDPEPEIPPPAATLSTALEPFTVARGSDTATTTPALSAALFESSTVAVVTADDDDSIAAAIAAARRLRVPVLPAGEAATAELDRLRATTVLAVGTDLDHPGTIRVEAAGAAAEAERLLALHPRGPTTSDAVVLLTDVAADPLGNATARAAGAIVVAVPEGDPRTDATVTTVVDQHPDRPVVAVGDELTRVLPYALDVVREGVEQPGGGHLLLPGRMLVALYGHPGSPALGVLGEQDLEAAITRARKLAERYEPLVDVPVVPTFEMIATVASAEAGKDGDYSRETDVEKLRPWVDAAREAGVYVILDLQPGRTDFLTQAKRYESLLLEPHVGLALDPEWRLKKHQRHLVQIGSVSAAEINRTSEWLAELTRTHRLPQKAFVLHQFWSGMITDRHRVDTSHPELSVIIHVDGHGTPAAKRGTWDTLRRGAPDGVFWGWKNFHDEDSPMLDPRQTTQVKPRPELVTYQ